MKKLMKREKIVSTQQVIYWIMNIFLRHYKLIAIDLSKQIELENPDLAQQINFTVRLDEDNATIFFIIKKSEETTLEFSQNTVTVV